MAFSLAVLRGQLSLDKIQSCFWSYGPPTYARTFI
jgi:hypothetical protein